MAVRRPFRRQVLGLVLLVTFPLLGLSVYRAFERRDVDIAEIEARSQRVAGTISDMLVAEAHATQTLLEAVARAVDPREPMPRISAKLAAIRNAARTPLVNLVVLAPGGGVLGAAAPPLIDPARAKRVTQPLADRVLAADGFVTGMTTRAYVRTDSAWAIASGVPIRDSTGRAVAVALAAVLIAPNQAMQLGTRLPEGSVVTVLDEAGRVMMRSVDLDGWMGRDFSAALEFARDRGTGSGVDDVTSLDGTRRFVAYQVIPELNWIAYVGIPRRLSIDAATEQLARDLLLTALVALLVLIIANRTARRVVEPIESLTADAAAIAAGDEARRSRITSADEIGDLARAVNRMAETAVARRQALLDDVEARRRTEAALAESREALRQAQKMEALGTFAGGIAHDFNNYLAAITGNLELALEALPDGHEAREDAAEALAVAQRAAAMTRQILAFSRKSVSEPVVVQPWDAITAMRRLLVGVLGERITLDLADVRPTPPIRVDRTQFEQMLVNLATNARDAMPDGGHFTLTVERVVVLPEGAELPAGAWVVVSARDSGTGITPEVIDRVFEPFFTTKARERGTGLGLSLVYAMMQTAGGHVRAESTPGLGTTFRLYFPPASSAAETAAPDESAARAAGGTERLLLAEDDAAVREMTARLLVRAGYAVDTAPDGEEALRMLAASATPYDLLVTDVVMPRLTGRELWQAAHARDTTLRVLFISGYTDDAALVREIRSHTVPFLAKPFTREALLHAVRQALEAPPPSDAAVGRPD